MRRRLALLALPALLALALALGLAQRWPSWPGRGPVPVEELTVDRVVLDEDGVELWVSAGPFLSVRVAQVQVDGAYWDFEQDPLGALPPGGSGRLRVPFPWIEGESHLVAVVSRSGRVFEHRIAAARATPRGPSPWLLLGLGLALGGLPLAFAVLAPRSPLGVRGGEFLYALTVGVLGWALVGTAGAALAAAQLASPGPTGELLTWLTAGLVAAGLVAFGRVLRAWSLGPLHPGAALARLGVQNACRGLAVGAAAATGAAALAGLLAAAFVLHQTLQAVALAAPAAGREHRPVVLALAGAGLAAAAGVGLGGQALAPRSAAPALAVGVGAILHVILGAAVLLAHRALAGERDARAACGLATGALAAAAAALLAEP